MAFFEAIWDIFTSDSTYVNGALFAGLLLFAASGEWIAERRARSTSRSKACCSPARSPARSDTTCPTR